MSKQRKSEQKAATRRAESRKKVLTKRASSREDLKIIRELEKLQEDTRPRIQPIKNEKNHKEIDENIL